MPCEAWADVTDVMTDGHPVVAGYQVSNSGRIRFNNRLLRGFLTADGYVRCELRGRDGKRRKRRLHRLVAFAFLGPPPPGHTEVRHLDGVPSNNAASNLSWGTHQQNEMDKFRHGTGLHGERALGVVLSRQSVGAIVSRHAAGESQAALARAHGVSQQTVSKIVRGLKWWRITGVGSRQN